MACTIDFSRLARLNQSRWARFIRRALLRFFEIVSSSALAKNSSPPMEERLEYFLRSSITIPSQNP